MFRAGERLRSVCGTPYHWAPKLCLSLEYEGFAVDIWSLGVLLHLMVMGCPFQVTTSGELRKWVWQARCDMPTHVSPAAQSLVAHMLTVDPKQSPMLEGIMGHPWLSQASNIL